MGLSELPEGPVTLMFTDIEGSTALRTTLGDTESDALFRAHDELVRRHIEEHQGRDQKAALGDGFLAVFLSTRRALACAIAIQRALDSFNLDRIGRSLRVRIGLNTGEVAWQDGQLSGEAVHAAARVCAEASGGQILISDVTRQLAGTVPDISFRDTGEHQLKGFPEPWRLWEVVWVRETTQVPRDVFVGRDAEMSALRARLVAALDGRGGLVLVGGEPGVGKTTLVRQLIREAEQRGALAVFGRCYESEGTVPYSPFVEMLEQALAIMPPEIVREDMGEDASEVARMVPELRRRFPDIGEPLDLPPEQQRRYFFNAVSSFIARGSNRFPLMLVMDDLHWADEPTLLLIEHMAALMPELRVLGVGTYRDVELDVARPLAATLERLVRARVVERVSVRRFDRDTVATMLEALAGRPAPDVLIDVVFDETEGNPFFVEEVFRHLVEEGRVFDEAGDFRIDIAVDELDVPESVRLVVGRRLERLGPEAQKVLAAGAVVGRGFPFSLLEEIVDTHSDRLLDIVEEAEAAKVIVPEPRGGEVHYTFAHELIRQTLLSGLSLLRRQRLHLAVANAIERTDPSCVESRPSELAHHLLEAGAGADTERTLRYLERAAARALDAAAFEEALSAVDDALALVDESDEARRAKLQERKGWTVRALGDFEQCIDIWQSILPIYEGIGEQEAAARLCWELGYQYIWLNRFAEAFAAYARGVEMLGDRRSAARATLLGSTAALLGLGGSFDAAEAQFGEALALAEELGDARALGRIHWGRTMSYWSNLRLEQAVDAGRAAVEYSQRAEDPWTLVDAAAWTSYPLNYSGRTEEGRRLAQIGVDVAVKIGHLGGELLARRGITGAVVFEQPELGDLEHRARDDLERLSSIRSPWVSQGHAWVSALLLLRGEIEESLAHADEAVALEPVSAWSGIGWSARFLNRAMVGDVAACRALLDESAELLAADGADITSGRFMMMCAATEGCSVLGFEQDAAALYPAISARADEMPVASFWTVVLTHRIAGMAATAGKRWDDAERHFATARRQVDELPNPLELPSVLHWRAAMLLDRGEPDDREQARAMLGQALDGYRRFGMPLHTAMAQELLG